MTVAYAVNGPIAAQEAVDLLRATTSCGPLNDLGRVRRVTDNAVCITARDGEPLAGYVRALTDYASCCWSRTESSPLPTGPTRLGGIRPLRDRVGEEVNMLLMASETGDSFYEHLGWERLERGWRLRRRR